MFEALHEKNSLPMQNVSPDELAVFYKDYGVAPERFLATIKGDAVEQKLKAARAFAQRTKVPGTPALVINGRYLVKGDSFEALLRNADALIVKARSERTR